VNDPRPASAAPAGWPHPVPARRVAPLPPAERPAETEEILRTLRANLGAGRGTATGAEAGDAGPDAHIFATLARHPRLLKRWSAFGGVLLFRGELPDRDRELLVLRTAWNCRAHYEWGHHVPWARRVGVSDEEVSAVTTGPSAATWSAGDAVLLRAADELHGSSRIGDATWAALADRYTPAQLIEICMVVGQYHLVAFTLNSLGVQLEEEMAATGGTGTPPTPAPPAT
jgi:4-carboxymuconolactone decarboxylase